MLVPARSAHFLLAGLGIGVALSIYAKRDILGSIGITLICTLLVGSVVRNATAIKLGDRYKPSLIKRMLN